MEGTLAVVTGASRGIGRVTAGRLHREGAYVVRLARSLSTATGERRADYPCDVTVEEQVRHVADCITRERGVPDIVVNNAGAFLIRALADTSLAEFQTQVQANLIAPFLVVRAFLARLVARGSGHIINVGSVADHQAFSGNAAYAASKFGLRGMHEVLRAEVAGTGVRCTLVSPGPTDTSLWDPMNPDAHDDLPNRASMMRPDDVADAVLYAATRPAHVEVEWIRLRAVG